MIRTLAAIWRWSWVLTIPASIAFLYWADQTWDRYREFGLRYRYSNVNMGMRVVGLREIRVMVNRLRYELGAAGGVDSEVESFPYVSLFINEGNESALNRNLPHSGFQEVEARILRGTEILDCDVRYRGDNAIHWANHKKSWRVEMDKDELWGGMRRFNLIAPKGSAQLHNYLGYRLAKELGLLAPQAEFVQLVINGRLRGVHLLVEQLDESTLRRNGYMPGDLYSGELIGNDTYRGLRGNYVFERPEIWNKMAVNNHYDEASLAPLEALTDLVSSHSSEESQQALSEMLDMEVWGRYAAFELLAQTLHTDETHNWRLYWDANRGTFIPVIWDSVALALSWRPNNPGESKLDLVSHRLNSALMRNGDFLRARHKALAEFFAQGKDAWYLNAFLGVQGPLRDALSRDIHRSSGWMEVTDINLYKVFVALGYVMDDLRREYLERQGEVRFAKIEGGVAIEVGGRRPVDTLRIRFDEPPAELPRARIRYVVDGQPFEHDLTGSCEYFDRELQIEVGLVPEFLTTLRWISDAKSSQQRAVLPAYYELAIDGWSPAAKIREIRGERGNGLESAIRVDRIEPSEIHGMYQLVGSRPTSEPIRLSGTVTLEENYEVTRDVFIAPGTTIELAPGVSLRFRGRVLALGTSEQPIRFVPARKDQKPWGVVALQGMETSGSRFRYCNFAGGSGWKEDLFEYSGMFSIHDSEDIELRHCRFQDSKIVDDMVHTVYAKVAFYDCVFERALMDALDMDISEGVVVDCDFRESGNDFLDLMTSKVVVHGTNLVGGGDKGISVGENTTLLCTNSRFIKCNIGIEVKDASRAFVYNSLFDSNGEYAVHSYRKNWRYDDGGHAFVRKSRFVNSIGSIDAEKRSSIEIRDCYLDAIPSEVPKRVVYVDSDTTYRTDAQVVIRDIFPSALKTFEGVAAPYFLRVDFETRGPLGDSR